MKQQLDMKRLILLNLPYVFAFYFVDKVAAVFRLAPGSAFVEKLTGGFANFGTAFANPLPSFHPMDLLVGVAAGLLLKLAVYIKGKNRKKFRQGEEYGSARWGRPEDIKPYVDDEFSNNIILTWAAVEATTLSTVFLVGIYKNKQALEASWKYAMVCTAGVAFGLFGTLLIYANAADIMPNAHEAAFLTSIMPYADQFDPMLVRLAFAFIVIGFGTKAGLFPMHTWLPDAHSQAPSPVSALLSGVLLKCAMLVIIRFYSLSIITVGDTYPRTLLLILGTLSILVAALCIFKQDDIKRRFAYSSVDNVGVVALCLGIGGPLGIAACLLHCIFHGFTKALAFCMAGNIQHIYHTRDLNKIKGVVEIAPVTAALTIIALLALAAFPPFALFISEFLTFVAGVQSGPIWVVVLVAIGLTGVYFALTGIALKSIFGKAPEGMKRHEVPALMIIPEIALAIVVMWFGIATPVAITSGVEDATSVVLNQSVEELHEAPLYRMVFSSQTKTSEVN